MIKGTIKRNADGTVGNIDIHKCEGKFHLGSNVGKIELLFPITSEEFIVYYLKSSTGNKQLKKHMKATAQESISMEALRDVLFSLPPLSEQKRIVAKIADLFKLINSIQNNL